MKQFLVFTFLLMATFNAFAGRETHGILPTTYTCSSEQNQDPQIRIELHLSAALVTSATLQFPHGRPFEISCHDFGPGLPLPARLRRTVVCSSNDSSVQVDLYESEAEAKAVVRFQTRLSNESRITIPCN